MEAVRFGDMQSEDVPLAKLRHLRKHSNTMQSSTDKETDGILNIQTPCFVDLSERHVCVCEHDVAHVSNQLHAVQSIDFYGH